MYADGMSPRSVAEQLNAEGIPSPGSTWNRKNRRKSGWSMTAIAGDRRRGVGILNNELYRGCVIWNRFRWVRSAADSSKRKCVPNPDSEWIVHDDPRLKISVRSALWDRAKARQRAQSDSIGDRIQAGLSRSSAKSTGRLPAILVFVCIEVRRLWIELHDPRGWHALRVCPAFGRTLLLAKNRCQAEHCGAGAASRYQVGVAVRGSSSGGRQGRSQSPERTEAG